MFSKSESSYCCASEQVTAALKVVGAIPVCLPLPYLAPEAGSSVFFDPRRGRTQRRHHHLGPGSWVSPPDGLPERQTVGDGVGLLLRLRQDLLPLLQVPPRGQRPGVRPHGGRQ